MPTKKQLKKLCTLMLMLTFLSSFSTWSTAHAHVALSPKRTPPSPSLATRLKIQPLQQGQKAPYSGWLIDTPSLRAITLEFTNTEDQLTAYKKAYTALRETNHQTEQTLRALQQSLEKDARQAKKAARQKELGAGLLLTLALIALASK